MRNSKLLLGKYLFCFSMIVPLLFGCQNNDINYNNYRTFLSSFKKIHSNETYLPDDGWYMINRFSSWDGPYLSYSPYDFKSQLKIDSFVGHLKFVSFDVKRGYYCKVDAFERHYSFHSGSNYSYFDETDIYYDGSCIFQKHHFYDTKKIKEVTETFGNDDFSLSIDLSIGLFAEYNYLDKIKSDLDNYIFDSSYSFTHFYDVYDDCLLSDTYQFDENYGITTIKRKSDLYYYSRVETIELIKLNEAPTIVVPTTYDETLSSIGPIIFLIM